jgi:hypothetical protein
VWNRDTTYQLNCWVVVKNDVLQEINIINKTHITKFKEKLRCYNEIEIKKKLIYYKETINSDLKDQNYLFVVASFKKKINVAK